MTCSFHYFNKVPVYVVCLYFCHNINNLVNFLFNFGFYKILSSNIEAFLTIVCQSEVQTIYKFVQLEVKIYMTRISSPNWHVKNIFLLSRIKLLVRIWLKIKLKLSFLLCPYLLFEGKGFHCSQDNG